MRLGREGRACDTGCKPIVKYMFAPEQCSVNTPSNLEKTSTSLRSSRETSRILKDITFSSWRDIFALIGNSRAPNMIWYDMISSEANQRELDRFSALWFQRPLQTARAAGKYHVRQHEALLGERGRSDGHCCCWHPPRPQQHPSWTYRSSVEVAKERSLVSPSLPASISWQNYSHSPPESHHASWKLKVLSEYLQYLSTQPIYVQILW